MHILAQIIHCLFPLIALVLLVIGIRRQAIYYVVSALWLSLISLTIHYLASGGQILGSYFNYLHAAIYSANLIILFIALIRVVSHLSQDSSVFKYLSTFVQSLVVIGSLLVMTNLWINAFFIENRMSGTPVMQVALVDKPGYCTYKYIFYKVARDGTVIYLCPNHYGFIPSIGHVAINPDFVAARSSVPGKQQMFLLQKMHA